MKQKARTFCDDMAKCAKEEEEKKEVCAATPAQRLLAAKRGGHEAEDTHPQNRGPGRRSCPPFPQAPQRAQTAGRLRTVKISVGRE